MCFDFQPISPNTIRNVWRAVGRMCTLILGLKRFIDENRVFNEFLTRQHLLVGLVAESTWGC